jgi:hypothetical protein
MEQTFQPAEYRRTPILRQALGSDAGQMAPGIQTADLASGEDPAR